MGTIFLPFVLVLFVSIAASVFASRREKDFFLASRAIRWPLLMGTFVGTHIGGGFLIGNTDAVAREGLSGAVYSLGLCIGMVFLGMGWGPRLRGLCVGTLPELLGKRYGSVALKKVAACLTICSLSGILISQAVGLKQVLVSMDAGPGFFVVSWALVVIYTSVGGLLAVVWTDLLQASIMVLMLVVLFITLLVPEWSTLVEQVRKVEGVQGISLSSIVFPVCYMFVTQDMAQRCFAAKTAQDATKGCLGTALVFLLLSVVPVGVGLLAKSQGIVPEDGSVFMQMVDLCASPWLRTVTVSTLLLAIVSTASTILLALSSNVVQDLALPHSKMITLVIGLVALLGPWFGDDIISWIVTSNALSVSTLFVPIIVAVWSTRGVLPAASAWSGFGFGLIGFFIGRIWPDMSVYAPFLCSALGFSLFWHRRKVSLA